ncbi:hypothetical protein FOZ62_014967 [Perkinsus olseni]|uniref:Uncharacterized protein n=1 Tax=Perkinsus olseni TaxID=32597 RepID=A0A7J6R8L9_PEROL|nr:hypothetical protein FOZ62_014967 [Perkinsus olseni]
MLRAALMFASNFFVTQLLISVYADASVSGNPVATKLDNTAELRSLRLPVVAEDPPNCLPPGGAWVGSSHCWYILRGPNAVNTGMLIPSNSSAHHGFATLELAATVVRGTPTDVGVWADGRTVLSLSLPAGIAATVDFAIPRFSKSGGASEHGGKHLTFPTELQTSVSVPFMGLVVEAKGTGTADAFVLTHWLYVAFVDVMVNGSKDGFELRYVKKLPIFRGSL